MKIGQAENPELYAFLESLLPGQRLSGVVAATEQFGVFVALDDGPSHPTLPGVGFITVPDLSWRRINAVTDVVHVGDRITCIFIQFDVTNMEARLSLRDTQPDPFQVFADSVAPGKELTGRVTKVVPIGAFVQVSDGIEGLVPVQAFNATSGSLDDVVHIGDKFEVVVSVVDREKRRLELGLLRGHPGRS